MGMSGRSKPVYNTKLGFFGWVALALSQIIIYAFLSAEGDVSAWWFFEPALVISTAWIVHKTQSHFLAIVMLVYVVLLLAISLLNIVYKVIEDGVTISSIFEAFHPLHRLKELFEFFALGAGLGNVAATSPKNKSVNTNDN